MARAPLLLPALAFVAAIAADATVLRRSRGARRRCVRAAARAHGRGVRAGRPARRGLARAPAGYLAESRTVRVGRTVVGDVRAENGYAAPLALDEGIGRRLHRRGSVCMRPIAPGERLVVRGRLVPFDEARNPGEPIRRAQSASRRVWPAS